jgi:hypothetical protein
MTVSEMRIPGWVLVLALAVGASLLFWPGSVGWDYVNTIRESTSWKFFGHQPPAAAIATFVLSLGTGDPFFLTVAKFLIYFWAIVIVLRDHKAFRLLRVLLIVLLLSPAFLYYLPLLRGNALEVAFLALAFAAGFAPFSRQNMCIAAGALSAAILISAGPNPGHLCLVVLYLLWHFPSWRLGRVAAYSAIAASLVLVPVLVTNVLTWKTDRSITLYISSIVGIDGLVGFGVPSCLPQYVVRETGQQPDEFLKTNTLSPRPYIGMLPFAGGAVGIVSPYDLSGEQRHAVINCWRSMIMEHPLVYLRERADWFVKTAFQGMLDEQFIYVQADGALQRTNDKMIERFGLRSRPAILALDSFGAAARNLGLDKLTPYAIVFAVLTCLAFLASPRSWRFLTFSVLAVIGFLLPHTLFGQAPGFRYSLVPSFVASCLAIAELEIIAASPLARWIEQLRDRLLQRCSRIWNAIGHLLGGPSQ